jgi:EmrB/QacA subfamily drug resistance transporter
MWNPLTARDKRITLAAATLGSFVVLLDSTVISIALPAIRGDLGGGLQSQQWIVNAYLLTLGSLLLIGGSLGDVFGERRVFVAGAAAFGVVSTACALAPTLEALIACRALQGAPGALLMPASLAVIVSAFPPDERGKAIGTWTAYSGVAAIAGPLAGGWLIDALSWRWTFAINLPFIVVALATAARMPTAEGGGHRKPDWIGAGLCATGLAGPTFALVRQPAHGWADALVAGPIIAGLAVFALFVVWERHGSSDPMLPLGLFASRNFGWATVETALVYGGLGLLFFVLVVYLQQVAGYSAVQAGATTIPTTIFLFLLSRRVGAMADRLGPRAFMTAGPLVSASGVGYLLAMIDESPTLTADVLPGTILVALGLALLVTPLTSAILADSDERNAGIASGVNDAVARVAALFATAAVGSIAGGALDLAGLRAALIGAIGLLVFAVLVGLCAIRNPEGVADSGTEVAPELAPSLIT